MRLKSKRLVSLLLAGSMMVSMVPASAVTAFAAEAKNIAVMAEDSDVAESVSLSVTVNAGESLETAVKNAAQSENKNWENITNLTVTTAAGKELDKADFEFVSGVHVEGDGISASSATYPTTDSAYLSGLIKLDLTDAKCEDDAIPTRAFCKNPIIKYIVLPSTLKTIGFGAFSAGMGTNSIEYVGTDRNGIAGSKITFPDSLETIGFCAFYRSQNLKGELVLPDRHINLESITTQTTRKLPR